MDYRIRERREALKMSQEELATLAGVHQSQVSAAENPGTYVSKPARAKIVSALAAVESSNSSNVDQGRSNNSAPMAKLSTSMASVLETSLGKAFDADKHLLRDANAVLAAFGPIALPQMTATELQTLCRQWLDAAAKLRGDGVPVTSQAIVAHVAIRAMNTH